MARQDMGMRRIASELGRSRNKLEDCEQVTVAIDAADASDEARMPPMMLLPLIDHAVAQGFGRASKAGSIRVVCSVNERIVRFTVVHSGGGFVREVDSDGLSAIRGRLAALYGDDACLELHRSQDNTTEAVMEIPCERITRHEPMTAA